jgi:hypothetical protein
VTKHIQFETWMLHLQFILFRSRAVLSIYRFFLMRRDSNFPRSTTSRVVASYLASICVESLPILYDNGESSTNPTKPKTHHQFLVLGYFLSSRNITSTSEYIHTNTKKPLAVRNPNLQLAHIRESDRARTHSAYI